MRTVYIVWIFAIASACFSEAAAQCYPDRHNNTWFDGWISCDASENPNTSRGQSHWILYEFSQPYTLYELEVWNLNVPDMLTNGLQNVVIDLSNDGENWTEHGEYSFPQASGESTYEGVQVMSFDSAMARYVLITAIDNYGGDCYGISEIRIRARDLCRDDKVLWIGGEGDWDVPQNWCAHVVPGAEDEVIIPSGRWSQFRTSIRVMC